MNPRKLISFALIILIFNSYQLVSFAKIKIVQNPLSKPNLLGSTLSTSEEKLVDVNYNNILLSDLLRALSVKYGVDVVFTDVVAERVSCNIRGVGIEEALNLVLCGTTFDFTKPTGKENTYVVFKTDTKNCRVGQHSKLIKLSNLEAGYVKDLLPEKLNSMIKAVGEQNAIIAEGTYNEIKEIESFVFNIDKPLKQIELEVKVIELKRNALRDKKLFRDSGFAIGQIRNGLSIFDFSLENWRVFNSQITYLETIGLAQIHAYPKVVAISGRTSMININEDTNIVLGQGTGFGQNIGVVSTQRLDTIMAGTNLNITPVAGDDNLITTGIKIEVSENNGITTQNGVTIPSTTLRREITSQVQVREGQTVAIGGLIINNRSVNRTGLPFITSIPVLGDFLSNRTRLKNQSELVILITPRLRDASSDEGVILRKQALPRIEQKYFESIDGQPVPKKKRLFYFFKEDVLK